MSGLKHPAQPGFSLQQSTWPRCGLNHRYYSSSVASHTGLGPGAIFSIAPRSTWVLPPTQTGWPAARPRCGLYHCSRVASHTLHPPWPGCSLLRVPGAAFSIACSSSCGIAYFAPHLARVWSPTGPACGLLLVILVGIAYFAPHSAWVWPPARPGCDLLHFVQF